MRNDSAGAALAAKRRNPGRKKKLLPCPVCQNLFGARERRKHTPIRCLRAIAKLEHQLRKKAA